VTLDHLVRLANKDHKGCRDLQDLLVTREAREMSEILVVLVSKAKLVLLGRKGQLVSLVSLDHRVPLALRDLLDLLVLSVNLAIKDFRAVRE
jgi:hypothetical protein